MLGHYDTHPRVTCPYTIDLHMIFRCMHARNMGGTPGGTGVEHVMLTTIIRPLEERVKVKPPDDAPNTTCGQVGERRAVKPISMPPLPRGGLEHARAFVKNLESLHCYPKQPTCATGNLPHLARAIFGCGVRVVVMGLRTSKIDMATSDFSRPQHLQGKGCKHWLGQTNLGFPFFSPM